MLVMKKSIPRSDLNRTLCVPGSEEEAPVGLEVAVTLMIMVVRRRAMRTLRPTTAQRRWAEAGTMEAEGDHLEEEGPPEEEVRSSD